MGAHRTAGGIYPVPAQDREIDKPYYTLEVEPNGTIRQKRTYFDRQNEDLKDAEKFLKEWQKVVSERLTESDREKAEKSKVLRLQEFEQLRQDDIRIHTGDLARSAAGGCSGVGSHGNRGLSRNTTHLNERKETIQKMKNGFTITQRNAVVEQHLWCIDTVMAQYAAFMQTEPVDPDDVYQSLAVRLIRAVNSYDPRKGYMEEYILSQLKREMVRIRSTQAVYGLTQAPANIGSTIVPLTIAAQRESYWETYIAV